MHEAWAQFPPPLDLPHPCRLPGATLPLRVAPCIPALPVKGLGVPTIPEWSFPSPEAFVAMDSYPSEQGTNWGPHDRVPPPIGLRPPGRKLNKTDQKNTLISLGEFQQCGL